MTSYKTPLLPPTREILNVGKIYKVAQFCTDLSKGSQCGGEAARRTIVNYAENLGKAEVLS
jgi:hypothetical protein